MMISLCPRGRLASKAFPVLATALILALGVSLAGANETGGLPRDCYLNQVGANPRNPATFYWCLPSGPVLMKCVDHFLFDIEARKCIPAKEQKKREKSRNKLVDFQELQKNKLLQASVVLPKVKPSTAAVIASALSTPDQVQVEPKIQTQPAPVPFCPVAKFGREVPTILLPSGASCAKFYYCANGTPMEFECPAGLYFNPDEGVCDWAARVKSCTGSKPSKNPPPVTRLDTDTDNEIS